MRSRNGFEDILNLKSHDLSGKIRFTSFGILTRLVLVPLDFRIHLNGKRANVQCPATMGK